MYTSDHYASELRTGNDIKAMEHPTLKVPYEVLNKKYRGTQKVIDREVSHLNQSLNQLRDAVDLPKHDNPKQSVNLPDVRKALDSVVHNLQVLKRKANESISDEVEAARVCKKRLDHLKGMYELPHNDVAISVWKKKRIDRLLVDHLLRDGHYETAAKLTEQSGLKDLTNMEIFMIARRVEESLESGDTTRCLAWCHDNKSKLRKIKSTLEFKLRQQEFIELIKQNKKVEAIRHARKYLCQVDDSHRGELEHIMGLLAQPLDTQIECYRSLLDKSRWETIIDHFKRDNYILFQLNSTSVFSVVLQAGLSALKTPHCYKKTGQRNSECPLCTMPLNELAKRLPYQHCLQSRLICSISGRPLNEDNPPMMLPNGYIYGELSLRLMMAQHGRIVCPKTQQTYSFDEALKVFVM